VLALVEPAVVEAPQFGALVLGVPLAEVVAVGVDALLGAGLLLVAAATTEGGGEALLLDGVEGVPIWRRLRLVLPSSTTMPFLIASSTLATTRRTPRRLTQESRQERTSGKS
jgi:hypothetical protein